MKITIRSGTRIVGTVKWKGDKPRFITDLGPEVYRYGKDFEAAARFLLAETAAISCRVNGYVVEIERTGT